MKFLHLTDLHLIAPGRMLHGRDPSACFELVLEHALAAHPDAAFMAITGDLTEDGEPDVYAGLRARLAGIGMPVHPITGNHDNRANFLAAFPETAAGDGFAQYAALHGGHRCLFLDTLEQGRTGGRLCPVRLAWLEAELAGGAGPFLIFLHHHPVPTMLERLDGIGLDNAAEFRAVVARHRTKIRHIFFGHCHMALHGSCAGVPCAALRSPHIQFLPDFAVRDDLIRVVQPAAYAVVFVGGDWISCQMVEPDNWPD